ncbi:LysR family transcriptional regulator [Radicibacter daui]|uniref:LysR family transcriptional regulator n=1 Tax=Radicibacter daui TaxID=3064829 RepID=UPI004046E573
MDQPEMRPAVDLNLLTALDVLLAECSVTRAARRLGLSPSAMSRTLARLRKVTGDPLLVQAGRVLVPTPYARELGERVHSAALEARTLLRPAITRLDLATLERTFVLRAGGGFVELLAAPLLAAVCAAAPQVSLHFVPKPDRDARPLREGPIDLEIGIVVTSAPEMRTQLLFRDRYVCVVRSGHPLLSEGPVTVEAYAACRHVVAMRPGEQGEPIEPLLEERGLRRRVAVTVPGYMDAMRLARASDLVALVPLSCLGNPSATSEGAVTGLASFEPPLPLPGFNICAIWHPRLEADPAHRWLRETLVAVCRKAAS